jgi:hypothetical protein
MDKEIIGYECPIDLYNGHVKKGTIYVKTWDDYCPQGIISYWHLLPKEIVEQWKLINLNK